MGVVETVGVAVSGAGTILGLNQQSESARQQQQAIANQELIARDNLIIQQQQLEQSKQTNEARFVQEKALLDAQTTQAKVNLEVQKEQAELQQVESALQADLTTAEANRQANELLAAAEAGETQAAQLNTADLFALAQQLEGSEEAAANFLTQAAAFQGAGGISQTVQNVLNLNSLEDIAQGQRVRETTTGRTRVAQEQGNIQRQQADLTRQQGILSNDYLASLQDIQNRANEIAFKQASFDIDNVSAQNLAGLEAAKFASQAEMQTARGAATMDFRSQQNALDAQSASVQQPNTFGSLAQLGTQTLGLLTSTPTLTQSSSQFGSTTGPVFSSGSSPSVNTSSLSFF